MHMKSLIYPTEEHKSHKLEQSKEGGIHRSSSATTNMMNSRRCPRGNVMVLLNGASPIIMTVSSINITK